MIKKLKEITMRDILQIIQTIAFVIIAIDFSVFICSGNFKGSRVPVKSEEGSVIRKLSNIPERIEYNFDEITKNTTNLGIATAPVKIIVFNSFSCGFCKKAREVVMEIRKRYSDKVQIIYKHFNRGDYDKVYANAVECAGEQGKFWEMYNALFDQRDENVAISANKIGVNIAVFNQCVASKKYDKKIRKDTEDGNTLGVRGTPSFLINKKLIVGFRPIEGFEKLIREELK